MFWFGVWSRKDCDVSLYMWAYTGSSCNCLSSEGTHREKVSDLQRRGRDGYYA